MFASGVLPRACQFVFRLLIDLMKYIQPYLKHSYTRSRGLVSTPPSTTQKAAKHHLCRRDVLGWLIISATTLTPKVHAETIRELEDAAFEAYSSRDFKQAVNLLTEILQRDKSDIDQGSAKWLEMRAQVLVDGKNFKAAMVDYDAALAQTSGVGEPDMETDVRARLFAGRALAFEGLSDWASALKDYNLALESGAASRESPDPYIINSMGNCYNSLGQWEAARDSYLISYQLFQQAKGFRGRNGTDRLDGAIFSASNAALMLAQMGNVDDAAKEMERITRRSPGIVDTRAALAAIYYDRGEQARAEGQWEFACDKIVVGCAKYQDADWLQRIRRWPPVMVEKMGQFLKLEQHL